MLYVFADRVVYLRHDLSKHVSATQSTLGLRHAVGLSGNHSVEIEYCSITRIPSL